MSVHLLDSYLLEVLLSHVLHDQVGGAHVVQWRRRQDVDDVRMTQIHHVQLGLKTLNLWSRRLRTWSNASEDRIFTARKRNLGQGNVFTSCASFFSQRHPLDRDSSRTETPWSETPMVRDPNEQRPNGQRPPPRTEIPWTETPGQRPHGQRPPPRQRPPGQNPPPPHRTVKSGR